MKELILVIDDSKTTRNIVSFILKSDGYRVITAEDGIEGLEKLYSNSDISLIIVDVNMPRMDGFTFIKNVRQQDTYKDLPIIILSTESEDEDIRTGIKLGANIYLVKPVSKEVLIKSVKMLLGKRKSKSGE